MAAGDDAQPDPGDGEDARSLLDDIGDLVGDAQTWFDAELGYQKVRAAFVGANLKQALVLGLAAAVLIVVAVMGLTFGLILALAPLVTTWGAMAIVVGTMLLVALLCGLSARKAGRAAMSAIREQDDDA
jgi:uncharacterized membrane protein YqjE